jgi:hypothetical protein
MSTSTLDMAHAASRVRILSIVVALEERLLPDPHLRDWRICMGDTDVWVLAPHPLFGHTSEACQFLAVHTPAEALDILNRTIRNWHNARLVGAA